ncbi:GOLPH3/VPS74 family protein [Arthrobacter sp. SO3]|uniref:GOLPH3/VPS74 family protein n=1 Tax=Arthrobacter sp. SO3 TaxID=1897057 RepID=UPI001CFFEA66|nr:GPP34 family phosphoprotein [Arthrobacter sp. SO3]
MDAETTKAAELSLPQAFLLLATNDLDGTPEVPVFALRTTLAGAILAELELLGAIGLQGKRVRATGAAPPTEFQHELELIRGKSRPHTPKRWVSMLEGRAEVQRVYEGMASLGIVERAGEKHLGLFKSTRYPEKEHGPKAALLEKLQAAFSGAPSEPATSDAQTPVAQTPVAQTPVAGVPDAQTPGAGAPETNAPEPNDPDAKASVTNGPDARTTALIALLHAAGLFGKLFPAADRTRAGELAKDYWPTRAVEDELRMIRLAQEEAATL